MHEFPVATRHTVCSHAAKSPIQYLDFLGRWLKGFSYRSELQIGGRFGKRINCFGTFSSFNGNWTAQKYWSHVILPQLMMFLGNKPGLQCPFMGGQRELDEIWMIMAASLSQKNALF